MKCVVYVSVRDYKEIIPHGLSYHEDSKFAISSRAREASDNCNYWELRPS